MDESKFIERISYTLLNFMGDVGSLFGAFQMIVSALLTYILQISISLDNYMIMSIFSRRNSLGKVKKFRLTFCTWLKQLPF